MIGKELAKKKGEAPGIDISFDRTLESAHLYGMQTVWYARVIANIQYANTRYMMEQPLDTACKVHVSIRHIFFKRYLNILGSSPQAQSAELEQSLVVRGWTKKDKINAVDSATSTFDAVAATRRTQKC